MTQSSLRSSTEISADLHVLDVKPGLKFSLGNLRQMIPDVETALFFAKCYELDAHQLGRFLHSLFNTNLTRALLAEGGLHSTDLQDYLLDGWEDEDGNWHDPICDAATKGSITLGAKRPQGEILPEVWKQLELEVADSIKAVAQKLEQVISHLPGKKGELVFQQLAKFNHRRNSIGVGAAGVDYPPLKENLVILDVSGSMTAETIHTIIEDVVALSYEANAHMAIVSNTCTYWTPGSYSVQDVLDHCEFAGTHYEQLVPLFDRDWGTVTCIADYDSAPAAQWALAQCTGRIDVVLDVSLVNRPTYLAECVGQLAEEVKPLLIAAVGANLVSSW
jgi:hypothetical protein